MIRDEIKARSIAALKAGDKATRTRLTGILGRFTEEEKSSGFAGWTEDLERGIVARYVKALKGSMETLGDRPLADDYRAEIALLDPYLPKLMDEAATRALVEPLVANCKGIGQLMGMVMKEHKGQVDAQLVRRIGTELGLS